VIPPLRGPTRQKAARKKGSGRSGRDDSWLCLQTAPSKTQAVCSGPFRAQGRRDDTLLRWGVWVAWAGDGLRPEGLSYREMEG